MKCVSSECECQCKSDNNGCVKSTGFLFHTPCGRVMNAGHLGLNETLPAVHREVVHT